MRGLRFCFITTFYPPYNFGGDGIAIQRMAQALVQRGHHVTVIHDVDAFNLMNATGEITTPAHDDNGIEELSPEVGAQRHGAAVSEAELLRSRGGPKYDGAQRHGAAVSEAELLRSRGGPKYDGAQRHGAAVSEAERSVVEEGLKIEEGPKIEVVALRSELGALAPLITHQFGRPIANRRRIIEILDRGSFDVITYHNISLIGGPGIVAYGSALKLYLAHDHWLVCPMHVLWRDNRELCTGKRCLRCTLLHRRPPQLYRWSGMFERSLNHVDAFIAASEFSREKHREFGFSPPMEVLPNFLSETDSVPIEDDAMRLHEPPYFLFSGRLEEIKGAQDLIAAFRNYADADLLIAGTGNYRSQLEAASLGNRRVKFLGHLEERELRRYYHHALAVIVPSVCYENFPLVVIEAFREATPVIARRLGPFPELIQQSQGGELFSDHAELIAAMRRIQSDADYRKTLGDRGHRAYRERWCASVVVPAFLQIVRRTAERRKRDDIVDALRALDGDPPGGRQSA